MILLAYKVSAPPCHAASHTGNNQAAFPLPSTTDRKAPPHERTVLSEPDLIDSPSLRSARTARPPLCGALLSPTVTTRVASSRGVAGSCRPPGAGPSRHLQLGRPNGQPSM